MCIWTELSGAGKFRYDLIGADADDDGIDGISQLRKARRDRPAKNRLRTRMDGMDLSGEAERGEIAHGEGRRRIRSFGSADDRDRACAQQT